MSRPNFVNNEDILRWSEKIDSDLPSDMADNAIIREVCYAGQWLVEKLFDLKCPLDIVSRIQYTGGRLSFGKDPWAVHQELLEAYQNNELVFEDEANFEDLNLFYLN